MPPALPGSYVAEALAPLATDAVRISQLDLSVTRFLCYFGPEAFASLALEDAECSKEIREIDEAFCRWSRRRRHSP
jgi:hypothetical protein